MRHLDEPTAPATVLRATPDAPWLPSGGRADVVLAAGSARAPHPTCLVRLLAVRDGSVLTVPRADGRGPDLPTRAVPPGAEPDEVVGALAHELLVEPRPPALLGYVRNTVDAAPASYPWPAPHAYFAVWLVHDAVARPHLPGATLTGVALERALGTRHAWPLVAHALADRR